MGGYPRTQANQLSRHPLPPGAEQRVKDVGYRTRRHLCVQAPALSRTKFKLWVESSTVTGVKNAPANTDVALAVLVNVDGQGFDQTFTYDAVNRGMTACVCTATGNQQALTLAQNWDVPVRTLPGTMLRVYLSEVGAPRTPGAALLDALTSTFEWHAVLALTPCDEELG